MSNKMSTVTTRSKGYLDVQSVENWKYTTTNNLKRFSSKDEAKRFIIGTGKIWKLDSYKNGGTFIEKLVDSIDVMRGYNASGLEYIDDKGDVCYILFLIEQSSDGKSIQISHTQKKLSRSGVRKNASDNVLVEECNAGRWLMQQAYQELHLPEQTINEIMLPLPSLSSPSSSHGGRAHEHNKVRKYQVDYQYDLKNDDIRQLLQTEHSTSSPLVDKHSYYVMDVVRHKTQFLETIKEIQDFSIHLVHPENFVGELIDWCRQLQIAKQLSVSVEFSDGCKCILVIAAIPTGKEFVQLFISLGGNIPMVET